VGAGASLSPHPTPSSRLKTSFLQLGLYHAALNQPTRAIQAFNKALFLNPDHVPATIHLCQAYLAPPAEPDAVDLAAGILADLTRGAGWDAPEAWLFLARAYGLRGARERERECLCYALGLAQGRPVRDLGTAVGWCL
jgi:predicted Zn-dependent protease